MGLTVKRVERLLRAGVPGKYTDGDVKGLMLCVESKSSAHWLLRYQRDHKVRHLGLGGARDVPLASARAKARRERERIADGIDPLSVKRAERAAQRQAEARLLTFRQAAERCHAAREAGWSSAAHAAEFLSSLERWVYPHIGSLDVAAVGKDEVLRVLEQKLPNRMGKAESGGTFWTTKTITADRVRSRVHTVLDWAEARGYRAAGTPNPARWKGFLDQLLAAPRKIAPVKNMAAVPYPEVPAVMAALAADQNVAAQALRFIILTAARLSEAIEAPWSRSGGMAHPGRTHEGAQTTYRAAESAGHRAAQGALSRRGQPAPFHQHPNAGHSYRRDHCDRGTAPRWPQGDDPRFSSEPQNLGGGAHELSRPRHRIEPRAPGW